MNNLIGAVAAARRRSGGAANTPWQWNDPNVLTAHRYWRFYITASVSTGDVVTVCEIVLRNTAGAVVPATYTANNTGNGAASNVNDGNAGTFWGTGFAASSGNPAILTADLGPSGAAVIDQIDVTPRTGWQSQCIGTFTLQWSDDNINWFDATQFSNADPYDSGVMKTFLVRPYIVRFLFDDPYNGAWTTITELEIKNNATGDLTQPYGGSAYLRGAIFGTGDGAAPRNAFDNVIDGNYVGAVANNFVEYRFATQPAIDSVTVTSRVGFGNQAPNSFKLQISRDGKTYTTVLQPARTTGAWGSGETRTFTRTAPVFTTAASISGTDSTYGNLLTCNPGVQTMGPNINISYQWYKNDVAIPGATSNTYTPSVGDNNTVISCKVKATNEIGSTYSTAFTFVGGQFARYWRLRTWDGSYLTYMSCAELELKRSPNGTDFTLDGTPYVGADMIAGAAAPTLGSGVSYSGGVATCTSATAILRWDAIITSGVRYRAKFNYNMTAGSKLRVINGTTAGANVIYTSGVLSGSGTIDILFTSTNTSFAIESDTANYSGTISLITLQPASMITASATLGGYPATQAIDNNINSIWDSGRAVPAGGETLTFDFQAANIARVQEFSWMARADGYREDPKGLYLEWSSDNVSWNTYWNTGPLGAWQNSEQRVFQIGSPTGAAAITGTPNVGATITADTSGVYNATSFTYQWTADGVPIIGATASTYVVTYGDYGRVLTCIVKATNTFGITTFKPVGKTGSYSAVSIRAQGIVNVSGAASKVIDLVALGAQAGDRVVFMGGHGFAYSSISTTGWTVASNAAGSNYNGFVIYKTLTAGDITTGTVTISFTGGYDGCISYVITQGTTNAIRYVNGQRDTNSPSVIATDASPQANDMAYVFGGTRGVRPVSSVTNGTLIQAVTQGDGAGSLWQVPVSANGALSETVTWSTGGTNYEGIVVFVGGSPSFPATPLDTVASDSDNILIDGSTLEM